MKKLLLALLLIPLSAHADNCATNLGNAFTWAQQNSLCGKFGSIGGPLRQNEIFGGQGFQPAYATPPAVITPATAYPTPAAAGTPTNPEILVSKFGIVATAAPTANFVSLIQATKVVGYLPSFGFYNESANPVAVVPFAGDSINLLAAGTPYPVTTGKRGNCDKLSNTQWLCTGT